MPDVIQQIKMLRSEGHHDAADLLERYSGRINFKAEFEYMILFVRQTDFFYELARNQLRAMWTAYCFHANLDVDTQPYDYDIHVLWNEVQKKLTEEDSGEDFTTFERFDDFMCAYLV